MIEVHGLLGVVIKGDGVKYKGLGIKIGDMVLLVMLALVLPLAAAASIAIYVLQHDQILRHTDAELEFAAAFAHQLLGRDYHDRIIDGSSVPPEEFNRIVQQFNELCAELDLDYIWSLMLYKDRVVFTSATSPDKLVANNRHAGFFEAHAYPELYDQTFRNMEIERRDLLDNRGRIRAVLMPHYDAHGRKYLICAGRKLSDIDAISPFLWRNTAIISLIFLIPGLLLGIGLVRWLVRPISKLAEAAEAFGQGRYDTELESCSTLELNILANEFSSMRDSFVRTLGELEEFRKVISQSPILIYRVNLTPNLEPEFISDNFAQLGYNVDDLRRGAITWDQIVPSEDLERIRRIIQEALASGQDTYSTEIRLTQADGELLWYKCWNQFIRNKKGTAVSLQGVMMDISDLRAARERDIIYQNRLRALSQDLLQAEERERRQLAMALHDDIGQMLAALNMKFAVLKETENPAGAATLLPQIETLMSRIMHTTKTLTWEISPTTLYETDLGAGLARMAAEIKDFFGLEAQIDTGGTRVTLDKNTSAIIFRCTKELLVNVAKHAGVKSADVGISHYGDKAHLVVSDAGRGFDPASLDQSLKTKYGLFSIRERIEHIGGSMRIESAPGKGTKVMLIIPLDIQEILS